MIVIDIETTGNNPEKHSLVSIGALDFFNPSNQFYGECHIWEGAEISYATEKVIGFTKEQLRDTQKPTVEVLIQEFLQWSGSTGQKILAGHNTSFDRDFLKATAKRAKIHWPYGYRTLDLHTLCYAHMLGRHIEIPSNEDRPDVNSDVVFEYVGLPKRPGAHNALEDTKLEAESFSRLINGTQLLDEYHEYPIPEYLQT